MRRGFKCKQEVLMSLEKQYDKIVNNKYDADYLESIKDFNSIAEDELRSILKKFYSNQRSRDQAWRTCKGSIYEYAVYKCIHGVINSNEDLKEKVEAIMGDEASEDHKKQIVINNWSDIFPDVDILIINKNTGMIMAILSCKTSLRERLTETAFWKRELENKQDLSSMKLVFITTDKDRELRTETNRYILLHIVDNTFITDRNRYEELVSDYRRKYGERDDFNELLRKVRFIDGIEDFILDLLDV